MSKLDEILEEIQKLRKKIEELAKTHELSDPGVVEVSQQLDERLNEYERIIRGIQLRREE